ncbi:molecular chaperone HscC [Paenibacillus sp. N1-5-1-14]|uniref:molecular chaperone HscC n=1 Tax=Paenibacillus radicibacter TaxID=2972488 RepID=UPI00215926D0|nr:molecular chaperone HscC [Paenibacillus radicibacter]MCR8645332.1 molecular chaperone HscC [Paenibacillus radicibacter]
MLTIGIDLGTSNSLAAYWEEDRPVLIPNALGEYLTPSIVSVDESGEILVGRIAKERLITHPEVTEVAFKRFMGTEKIAQMGQYSFTPEELSSFIVRSLKEDAEAHLGQPVTEAVISVPAYFNDAQRKATKRAAELAGLKVERLISEPTAAALAYGLHLEQSDTKFLVFDLGGGTFDVSVLEYFEGVMEVKSIAGDNYLGGEDFTHLLVTHFADKHKLDYKLLDSKMKTALNKQADQCKYALGHAATATMHFTYQETEYELTISRSEFESIAGSLILRLRNPIERALRDASITPNELDAVILIGGASRMPVIKSIVGKIFGRLPYVEINPDEAVALGAAVQVALKERNALLREMILTDVCPYTLGTSVAKRLENGQQADGYYHPIIERNSPIPISRMKRFYTMHDRQSEICIDVYQGESRRVDHNIKLGEMMINVPPAKVGEQSVDVRYTYDINGILEVEVTTVSSGEKQRMIIENNPGAVTAEEIEARFLALQAIKIHPRDRAENRLLLARGERLYEEALRDKREFIANLIMQYESILETQDEQLIGQAADKFREHLEQLERWQE